MKNNKKVIIHFVENVDIMFKQILRMCLDIANFTEN